MPLNKSLLISKVLTKTSMRGNRHNLQPAKVTKKPEVPYPNIITQVNKEDEKKYKLFSLLKIYKCCSFFLRCFTSRKQNYGELVDPSHSSPSLLGPQPSEFKGKKTLVLDLDETLVHSTFEPVANPDLVLPVRIQGVTYRINVIKRPGTEEFLAKVGEMFEVVIFTASLAEYAEPLVRLLDTTKIVSSLLYRQHCTLLNGVYVKDLSLIGRDLKDVILVDNSPNSFLLQPENAYHIKNFFDDKSDRELVRLASFLDKIVGVDDVRPIESLRQKFEPPHPHKVMKFVKINQESDHEPSSRKKPNSQLTKKKEDSEKSNNIETEPDLRKDEGKPQSFRSKHSERNKDIEKQYENYYSRAVPLTERVAVNDRLLDQSMESNEDIELPSPKESDMLINHRQAEDYIENNSNNSQESKKEQSIKPKVPPFAKSSSAIFKKFPHGNVVTVEDPSLDGQHLEGVRFLTGPDNLNSPLGRQVKIELPDVGS